MKKLGYIVGAIGVLLVVIAFGFDTAPEGTHNIGLMQEQMMIFVLGGIMAVVGSIAAIVGTTLGRFEDAGLIPPAGFKPATHLEAK